MFTIEVQEKKSTMVVKIKAVDRESNPIKQQLKEGKAYVIVQDTDDTLVYFNLDK